MNANDPIPPAALYECEALALRLAPDLGESRLRCVNAPAHHPIRDCSRAFTGIGANDFVLRDELIRLGRWPGPCHIIAFCMPLERMQLLAIALHELAHLLPSFPPADDFDPSPELRSLQAESFAKQLDNRDNESRPPWIRHEIAFVRRCVHLHARAWDAGIEVGAGDIHFGGTQYGMSAHWKYLRLFENEARRMLCQPFDVIDNEPYPPEALELWRHDVAKWYREHPESILTPGEKNECA